MLPDKLPALGFGTSNLLHHGSKQRAIRTLQYAFEHGLTYFDTAPIYGYGWSEKILGHFTSEKRHELTLTTKVGLTPGKILSRMPFWMLHSLRNVAKAIHSSPKGQIPSGVMKTDEHHPDLFLARQSLEKSLRNLRTDHVDILLLHEANTEYANRDDVLRMMEDFLTSGKTIKVGLGSAPTALTNLTTLHPLYSVVQTTFSLTNPLANSSPGRLTNVYGIRTVARDLMVLGKQDEIKELILGSCGLSMDDEDDAMKLAFSGAYYQNTGGMTIFSSTQHDHIRDSINTWNHIPISKVQFQSVLDILKRQAA